MDNITILVCDDDRDIVQLIRGILEGAGYRVIVAYNGADAYAAFGANEVELIIMDVMMPQENGLMATMKIREKSNVPILMLSAKTEESDRVIGLDLGADDYMTKPFYREELLAKVRSLLRRYLKLGGVGAGDASQIIYHDLVLDTEKKRLLKAGEEIHLTATEYKIVELLLSKPGRVFPAEEIYERVWGQDAYAVENTVMVHISRIRKKLEVNPERPEYLKIVWGVGYKIEK
ncbi:MAG: response regulator transcription factor [Lachnospiraceae bacterium]|nr:response regulator transcription factor [Lachnospiraceae bacterium]